MKPVAPPVHTNPLIAAEIESRTKKNLGVFSVPKFNHTGDPHDKFGKDYGYNRLMPTLRDGMGYASPTGLWKECIEHEQRVLKPSGSTPGAPPPPLSGAPAAAAAPATGDVLPPGWYYIPSVGADGQVRPALTYVPYAFARPPGAA